MIFLILAAVWKVIRSWLTEEQKEKIILVKKADMSKYIAKDQLEEHMVGGQ
jgi:carbamate kinase